MPFPCLARPVADPLPRREAGDLQTEQGICNVILRFQNPCFATVQTGDVQWLTLSSARVSPLTRTDRDRPSASSIKATTPFQAAIGIALLVDIIRATSDFTVEPRATCEPWVKHTCLDEQDGL